jgi:hypothetical protein
MSEHAVEQRPNWSSDILAPLGYSIFAVLFILAWMLVPA